MTGVNCGYLVAHVDRRIVEQVASVDTRDAAIVASEIAVPVNVRSISRLLLLKPRNRDGSVHAIVLDCPKFRSYVHKTDVQAEQRGQRKCEP
jgi:hypothetical protein